MNKPKTPRPLLLFYVLVVYVLLQFSWWAYLLIRTNNSVAELQKQSVTTYYQPEKVDSDLNKRRWMIIGEGIVFLVLLVWAIQRTRIAFRREELLAERQKNFLLSVTHELRSPLASIGLQAETLIKRDLPKEKQSQILSNVLEDTERLNALIGNILLAARIDTAAFTLEKSKRNFSHFVEQLADKIHHGVGQQHKFDVQVGKNIEFDFDDVAAHSIIANLIENAVKYSKAGTTIAVSLKKKDSRILLAVADEGKGIPDSFKQTVFERFYRTGSEETRSTKGTGLGLYIASYLADMHGWKITITDNKPQGSIFTIDIPDTNE
jgi:two-component system, OmpR family, phosphate regulon sensor histidine kinase PhoR